MKIVAPSVTVEHITPDALRLIERAGRTCWKSEDRIGPGTAEAFVRMLLSKRHESVLEHASATLRFVCDRGVSHELVRHRVGIVFSQESTRYVCQTKERHGGELQVIRPPLSSPEAEIAWEAAMIRAEDAYKRLLDEGEKPEIARSVLPTCAKTEIVATANFRAWRHIFALRTDPAAHPQMRALMREAQTMLWLRVPAVFDDPLTPAPPNP